MSYIPASFNTSALVMFNVLLCLIPVVVNKLVCTLKQHFTLLYTVYVQEWQQSWVEANVNLFLH